MLRIAVNRKSPQKPSTPNYQESAPAKNGAQFAILQNPSLAKSF